MSDVQLLALERNDGADRLVVRWRDDGQKHSAEVAVEHRTLEGWQLRRHIVVQVSELFLLRDALDEVCQRAAKVRR